MAAAELTNICFKLCPVFCSSRVSVQCCLSRLNPASAGSIAKANYRHSKLSCLYSYMPGSQDLKSLQDWFGLLSKEHKENTHKGVISFPRVIVKEC